VPVPSPDKGRRVGWWGADTATCKNEKTTEIQFIMTTRQKTTSPRDTMTASQPRNRDWVEKSATGETESKKIR